MDPRTEGLDEERAVAGGHVLKLTDQFGFGAVMAAWVWDIESEAWKFLLTTPMLNERGPEWIYERLLRIFRIINLPPGIVPLDIYVLDLDAENEIFGDQISVHGDGETPKPVIKIGPTVTLRMAKYGFNYMEVYRRLPPKLRKPVSARRFDHNVRSLEAA